MVLLNKQYTSISLFFLLVTTNVHATEPLFADNNPLNAVLASPLSSLQKYRKQEVRLYQPGKFSYAESDQEAKALPVKVRTRGNFRRLNCANPPLMLNFRKKQVKGTLLSGQDKLKLVSPCKRSDYYRTLVALEYIAYQVFEQVSEHHFKTRLINLGMIDTDGKKDPWKTLGFVIEDERDMAKRTSMKPISVEKASRTQLDHGHTALVEMFQLFLGNTDYSTLAGPPGSRCCHNVRLIGEPGAASLLYPVPYDFDASGFINARYSAPSEQYPIERTTQRYFNGWCKEERFFRGAIDAFLEKKPDIYKIVNNSDLLEPKVAENKVRFVDKFYDIIESEAQIQEKVLSRCRGDLIKAPV